jgi:hypothetical protein
VAKVDVAVLIIDESIEAKINAKIPPLTGAEVREVAIYARDARTNWSPHPVHGLRLVVQGRTYRGRLIIAYLMPLNEHDPEEGTFKLKTAMAETT